MSDKEFEQRVAFITLTIIIILLVIAACFGSYESHNYTMTTESHIFYNEEVVELHYPEPVYEPVPAIRMSNLYELSEEERYLLQQEAMAEARGEDAKGQALVMRVILNRYQSGRYGDSIKQVIYAPGQFSTAGVGSYVPNDNCNEALEMILNGWDESEGALYFCATGYNGKEPLFKHGGHYFSKGASK